MGKIYYAVIIEASSAASRECPKGSENLNQAADFAGPSLPMTVRLYEAPQSKTAKPGVSAYEGLCAHPIGWVASVHLPKIETRCWSLCAPLSGETILPLKCQE